MWWWTVLLIYRIDWMNLANIILHYLNTELWVTANINCWHQLLPASPVTVMISFKKRFLLCSEYSCYFKLLNNVLPFLISFDLLFPNTPFLSLFCSHHTDTHFPALHPFSQVAHSWLYYCLRMCLLSQSDSLSFWYIKGKKVAVWWLFFSYSPSGEAEQTHTDV